MPLVGVVMGSASDEPVVSEAVKTLEQLGIDYEVRVMSAHRTPERVAEYAQQARDREFWLIFWSSLLGLGIGFFLEGFVVRLGHENNA